MLFKNPHFQLFAKLIDASPVLVVIAGGAVRDEVNGRAIKDFDILVHEEHLESFLDYLEAAGAELIVPRYDIDSGEVSYGELPDDFDSRYVDWLHYQYLNGDYHIDIDVLVLGNSKYPAHLGGINFVNAVLLFDNTMNMYLYSYDTVRFLGGIEESRVAKQVRTVSRERAAHIEIIANELGWTYVPLAV